jgi:hypothetical protein
MRNGYQADFDPRPRRRRRLFWFTFGTGVLTLAVLGGLFYVLRNLAWFKVANFEVVGTSVPTSEVVNALKVSRAGDGLGALLGPDNTLFWQFAGQPDVALLLPLIDRLNVQPNLFSRTVKISATDRTLWAIVCESGGASCYAVDQSGIVFARVPDTEGVLILKIADANNRNLILGESFLPSADWLKNLTSVLNALNTSGYPVAGVTLDDFGTREWHALLASGIMMDFSFDFAPADFRSVLAGLKTQINLAKVKDIDFSVPQRIYYK